MKHDNNTKCGTVEHSKRNTDLRVLNSNLGLALMVGMFITFMAAWMQNIPFVVFGSALTVACPPASCW